MQELHGIGTLGYSVGSPACHRRVGCEGAARHGFALRRAQRRRRRKGLLCFALLCTLVQYCLQFAPSEAVTTFAHCTARCGRASLKASARALRAFFLSSHDWRMRHGLKRRGIARHDAARSARHAVRDSCCRSSRSRRCRRSRFSPRTTRTKPNGPQRSTL